MSAIVRQYCFHHVSSKNSLPKRELNQSSEAIDDYLRNLLDFLAEETSVRKFIFESGREPEAKSKLCALPIAADFDASADVLAKRLHEKQQNVESGTIKVQEGDLLTLYFESNGRSHVLLAKLEQMSFLNRTTGKKDDGFPFDKNRLLKTCHCELSKEDGAWTIGEVSIYDSSSEFRRFWWHDFLELTELTDDAKNSHRALAAWKELLEKQVKPVSKVDYHILRNNVGFFFRSPHAYNHKKFVKQILGAYQPESKELDVAALKTKAEKLPQQSKALDKRFDEEFDIDPKACNVKLRPIRLTPEIDLVLKAPVEHLKEVVKPAKVDGKKGVFVVSEEGYHEVSPK
jgi:hypothetical protein